MNSSATDNALGLYLVKNEASVPCAACGKVASYFQTRYETYRCEEHKYTPDITAWKARQNYDQG